MRRNFPVGEHTQRATCPSYANPAIERGPAPLLFLKQKQMEIFRETSPPAYFSGFIQRIRGGHHVASPIARNRIHRIQSSFWRRLGVFRRATPLTTQGMQLVICQVSIIPSGVSRRHLLNASLPETRAQGRKLNRQRGGGTGQVSAETEREEPERIKRESAPGIHHPHPPGTPGVRSPALPKNRPKPFFPSTPHALARNRRGPNT